MGFDLSNRLVVGVASSALFDLTESDAVFRRDGLEAYRAHQRERIDAPPPPGRALPFIRRLLSLNAVRPDDPPVEVVLLSRNDTETGKRLFRAFDDYDLAITRAAFTSGDPAHPFAEAFEAELFLSADTDDVLAATAAGRPAGLVTEAAALNDDGDDLELRIAFDFDGVLADDSSEAVYKAAGVDEFRAHELRLANEPMKPGPLKAFFTRIRAIQELEAATPDWTPRLRTALVTARGAPAHERVANTLEAWGARIEKSFFLGGVEKTAVLRALKPHIFFDDQRAHLDKAAAHVAAVHVPFGVANRAAFRSGVGII